MDAVQTVLIIALMVSLGVVFALWRRRQNPEDLFGSSPVGYLRFRGGVWHANEAARSLLSTSDTQTVSTEALAACVDPDLQATFQERLGALVSGGSAFDVNYEVRDGARAVAISGRRSDDGGTELWVIDRSEASQLARRLAKSDRELWRLRDALDLLPVPVWWRDSAGTLAGGNRTFAEIGASENADDDPLPESARSGRRTDDPALIDGRPVVDPFFPGGERAPGGRLTQRVHRSGIGQSESITVVREGQRRLYDVTETPLPRPDNAEGAGMVVGFARDLTALEELQNELAMHVSANDQMLEGLGTAIAIYGSDMRLRFFNAAFCRLWRLDPADLAGLPTIGAVMDLLRERRLLPEVADFPAQKRAREALFTSLIDPEEGYLHLPDDRTLRTTIGPHPLGGLVETFDDVTDRIALERSHNTLTAVQRMTLDSLQEGVCVFGGDGRVKLFNHVFANLFEIDEDVLLEGPHISELADRARHIFVQNEDWRTRREKIILAISDPTSRQITIHLTDGRVLDVVYVPLPDGQCLVLVVDKTDSHKITLALREKNAAFERADLLKAQFISSVSHELRSPLNAITGFAEILGSGMAGPLEDLQEAYVRDIVQASRMLAELIQEILDLAALQAGFLELETVPIHMVDLFQDLRNVIEESTHGSGHEDTITWSIVESDWLIDGDRERLTQAFRIMIEVALATTGAGQPMTVVLDHSGTTHRVRVEAADTELAMNELAQILRPTTASAQRLSTTRTGVGLTLAKNLIEHYGGWLELGPTTEDVRYVDCLFDAAEDEQ